MVREPDATTQPTLQDNHLMSKPRVLSFKPHLRLEWRGQDSQNETEQPDHSASLGDSIMASTQIRFSVHTRAVNDSGATNVAQIVISGTKRHTPNDAVSTENAVLRHQLIVLRRRLRGRVRLTNNDRWFFIQLYRWFPSILKVLTIIRPETLVGWHRAGFRCYWRWKSRPWEGDRRSTRSYAY